MKQEFIIMGTFQHVTRHSYYGKSERTEQVLYKVWAATEDEALKMVIEKHKSGGYYTTSNWTLTVCETLGTPE